MLCQDLNSISLTVCLGMRNWELHSFVLYFYSGTFSEEIESEFAYITHTMYAHQKYTNVFVSDLYIKRKRDIPGGGVITLKYPAILESEDITFDEPQYRYANRSLLNRLYIHTIRL